MLRPDLDTADCFFFSVDHRYHILYKIMSKKILISFKLLNHLEQKKKRIDQALRAKTGIKRKMV